MFAFGKLQGQVGRTVSWLGVWRIPLTNCRGTMWSAMSKPPSSRGSYTLVSPSTKQRMGTWHNWKFLGNRKIMATSSISTDPEVCWVMRSFRVKEAPFTLTTANRGLSTQRQVPPIPFIQGTELRRNRAYARSYRIQRFPSGRARVWTCLGITSQQSARITDGSVLQGLHAGLRISAARRRHCRCIQGSRFFLVHLFLV